MHCLGKINCWFGLVKVGISTIFTQYLSFISEIILQTLVPLSQASVSTSIRPTSFTWISYGKRYITTRNGDRPPVEPVTPDSVKAAKQKKAMPLNEVENIDKTVTTVFIWISQNNIPTAYNGHLHCSNHEKICCNRTRLGEFS